MAKRPAAEPLEDVALGAPSPASKRPRMEDDSSNQKASRHSPDKHRKANGHHARAKVGELDVDEEENDILGAADQMTREIAEAAGNDAEEEEEEKNDNDEEEQKEGDEDEDEDERNGHAPLRQHAPAEGYGDLYLDTIDRKVLDFDFEKLCSVTLSNINVYACLVCGKYYQGRGPKSQAYFHALEDGHHVYINMATKRVYVLPEGYEVQSKSLDDIKFVVDPWLSKGEVLKLDKTQRTEYDLLGRKYTPGFVGMNNIKANDYFNVVVHALAHVAPLRNFFMLEDLSGRPQLAQRFSTLVRKIWNPRAFKAHVSPHELLQEIALRSSKRFTLTAQSDPVDFLSWFLNNLHLALGGSRTRPGSSIVQKIFQGQLKVESQLISARADAGATGDRLRFEDADVKTDTTRFMVLTLDLPAAPLFQDELDRNIIPQVPLATLLAKYDGIHAQERLNMRVRYRLLHPLPPYLLLHIKRFSANKFVSERNPTIVTFPVRSLDLSPYVEPNPAIIASGEPIWYDLVANVTHEAVRSRDDSVGGEQERKVWRVHLRDKAKDNTWLEVQDLYVEPASADTVFTKESYLQVWERRKVSASK